MKVAVVGAKGLPATQGGIEYYCQEIYPEIADQSFQVDLFARREYTNKSSWITHYQQVRIIHLPCVLGGGVSALLNALFASVLCLFGNYDVVHFHALGPAFFSFIPRLFSRARVIVTCHGLDWRRAKWNFGSKLFLQTGEKIAAACAHEMVVVSSDLQRYFENRYRRRVHLLPTAPASYSESDPNFTYVHSLGLTVDRYIVFLGRLVPEKRPDLLVEAFHRLPNHIAKTYHLVIIGGTSDTDAFTQRLIDRARASSQIVLTGELTGQFLAEIIRGAGLFVLPSDLEGFPLVLLEAMREGIPVVASDIAPHREIIGEDRGRTFQTGNVVDCAQVMQQAITERNLSSMMAKEARNYILSHYQWEKVIDNTLKLYSKKTERFDSSSYRKTLSQKS